MSQRIFPLWILGIVFFALNTYAQDTKVLGFDKDQYHLSIGGTLNYHVPYTVPAQSAVGGGVTAVMDKSLKNHAAISLGAEFQSYWYAHDSNGEKNYRISPLFRLGFHPLGLNVIRGEVSAASHIDPYIMLKAGFLWDTRLTGTFYSNISPLTVGLRWFFDDNFALWTELDSWYSATIGISFWM